ncbi:adhesin [Mesobacillus campisalis]|uniref:Adhesin n=1 Tax=Mesobacillus campisalis TaxID=1408103 RepID=A0A0M2SS24_9BACI|nr:zinc ABC transporter substrate-binding protein [Mesobacillus campisalis]KKK36491.1 adhesin [Mesobacillus campisalis]
MKFKYMALGFIFVISIFLAGCNSQKPNASISTETDQQEAANQLKIFTTIYPLKDFTEKIGGEDVTVESIMPPGADAHTFEPTTKQMTNIAEADAFIYNGLGLEPFAEKMGNALKNQKVKFVEAAHGIETLAHEHDDHYEKEENGHGEEHSESDEHGHAEEHSETDGDGHDHGDLDPHVWLDPYQAITLAEGIKNTFVELKPDAKEKFQKNYESLKDELEKLDEEFHHLAESKENPEMVVSHAAYGYWEESYGIQQIPVAGLSPTDEPSQKALQNIIELARDKQIKYILFEQNVAPKVAEVIRKEINAEPLYLHNLSVITEEDIQNGEDYFSLMRKNIETLDKALK